MEFTRKYDNIFCVYKTFGKVSGSSEMEQLQASISTSSQGSTYCVDIVEQ
jgi:hypothetical protein